MENNLVVYKLIQINVSKRDGNVYLYDLVEEGADGINQMNNNFSINGMLFMSEDKLEEANTKFNTDVSSQFLIFYDYDYNTFKQMKSKVDFKFEYKDWLGDIVGVYSSIYQIAISKKPVTLSFEYALKNKFGLTVNQFLDNLRIQIEKDRVIVSDPMAKENNLTLQEIKRSCLKKDIRIGIRDIFVFNIDYVTISAPDNELSQMHDFVTLQKKTTDFLMFFSIDDMISNHCQVFESFFINAIKNTSNRDDSLLCKNINDSYIVNVNQNEIQPDLFGYYPKTLNKFHHDKLRNVHFGLLSQVNGRKYIVDPNYVYFHYNQDNFNDDGWGCAYRSLQTILSWYVLNGQAKIEIPTIPQIQKILVEMGDKQANFLNSKEWIGSTEVSYIIQKLVGVDSQIMFFQSGLEIPNYLPSLQQHFETRKTPIMIGGSVLAYTLLGIAFDEDQPQNSQFLILDPHYKGKEDIKKILNPKSKAIYWTKSSIFKANAFYNFCCPLPK
jgi:hypothetical protein